MNPVMFNAEFYLAQNEDVRTAVANGVFPDALTHFQQFGQFELRDPNAFFDTSFYLSNNGDVLQALVIGTVDSAFQHFTQFGQFEDVVRAPNETFASFDAEAYLANNPDVAAAVAAGQFPNAFAHFLQFGVNENREGAPNFEPGLDDVSQAVAALQVAVDARAAFDAEVGTTAALTAELEDAEDELSADIVANGTDRAIAADLADAQDALVQANAEVDGIAGLRAALDAQTAANAQLEAATDAAVIAAADQAAASARFEALTDGTVEIADDGSATFLAEGGVLGEEIPLLVIDGDDVVVADTLPAGVTAAQAEALRAAVQARVDADAAEVAAGDAVDEADGDVAAIVAEEPEAADAIAAVGAAELALTEAENIVEERAALNAAVTEAEATLAQSQALDAAIVTATEALNELGFDNVNVVDGVDDVGTVDEVDLFVRAEGEDGTITGFEAGEDVLFVGSGFTPVSIAEDFDGDTAGNAGVLEVFIQQNGVDTVLTFENQTFSGNVPGSTDFTTITLAGVDADDVTIDANGFLRVTPEAEALVA